MTTQSFVQRVGIFFCLAIFLFAVFAQFTHALVPPLCTGTRYSYTKIVAIDKGSLPTGVIVEGEGEGMYLNNTTAKPLVFKFPNVNRTVRLVDGKVYSNTMDSKGAWFEDELAPRGLSITFLLNDGPYVGINTPSQLPAPARFSAALQYDSQPINITGTVTYKLHEYDCAGKDVYVATFSTQTTSAVQAQIDALLKQITQLQTQIAALRGQSTTPTTGASSCLDLSNALVIGSTDATTNGEVSKLQRFLAAYIWDRFHDADGDSGISQPVTGYYGRVTAQNVMDWQKAHGMDFVSLTSGVGPMTRGKMACSTAQGQSQFRVNGTFTDSDDGDYNAIKNTKQRLDDGSTVF